VISKARGLFNIQKGRESARIYGAEVPRGEKQPCVKTGNKMDPYQKHQRGPDSPKRKERQVEGKGRGSWGHKRNDRAGSLGRRLGRKTVVVGVGHHAGGTILEGAFGRAQRLQVSSKKRKKRG